MPQGRRKAPFSGKAKKQQMQEKKQRQNRAILVEREDDNECDATEESQSEKNILKINKQPHGANAGQSSCALQFFQESRTELLKRREEARKAIEPVPLEHQELSEDYFPPEIDLPERPLWDFNMCKENLDMREQKYFSVSHQLYY